jgi:hypothetical protein
MIIIIIDFYFTNSGGWIEYSQNGEIIRQTFDTAESLHRFIKYKNLPLTYKGCTSCRD